MPPPERWNAVDGRFIRATLAGLCATYVALLTLGLTDRFNLLVRVAVIELALVSVGVLVAIRRPRLATLARGWLIGSMAFGVLVTVIIINAVITANQKERRAPAAEDVSKTATPEAESFTRHGGNNLG